MPPTDPELDAVDVDDVAPPKPTRQRDLPTERLRSPVHHSRLDADAAAGGKEAAEDAEDKGFVPVSVDVRAEILRMAERDGIKERQLKEPLDLTRFDYYRAAVLSYYQGFEAGQLDYARSASSERKTSALLFVAAVALFACTLAVVIARMTSH